MADNKDGEETSARGVDWEVVSLTESAYAASPGPEGIEIADDGKDKEFSNREDNAQTMFMSGHFVFPPDEHENLPIQTDNNEVLSKSGMQDVGRNKVEADVHDKIQEESWDSGSVSKANALYDAEFLDKGDTLCVPGVEFQEGSATLPCLNLIEEVKAGYSDSGFNSVHAEKGAGRAVILDKDNDTIEPDDPKSQELNHSPKKTIVSKGNLSDIPSESWWKRQAVRIHSQAKEASTLWSLCIAAALMGLVILGRQWHWEKRQVLQIRSKFSSGDEKTSRLLGPVARFKDVIIGGHRRPPVLHGGSSSGP